MKQGTHTTAEQLGNVLGYIVSLLVFSVILAVILTLLGNIPSDWTVFHVVAIALIISALGLLFKRILQY